MEALVRFLAGALVDKPDEIRVSRVEGDDSVVYELHVAPEELGRVIGRRGRTARAIRTVVRAAQPRGEKPVHVEIVD
ncbi:MAG TPA: KH domain-containing protein [Limnochordia bacterium]|nr:KH domain-containing protein [Limnochordia bacterium]